VADLKKAAEEQAKAEEEKIAAGFAAFAESQGGKQNQGKFYFYNISSLGYGRNDFRNRWGERTLEDDWRWSNKNRMQASGNDLAGTANGPGSLEEASSEERFSADYYLEQIPTEESHIDSLRAERNFANYQL